MPLVKMDCTSVIVLHVPGPEVKKQVRGRYSVEYLGVPGKIS